MWISNRLIIVAIFLLLFACSGDKQNQTASPADADDPSNTQIASQTDWPVHGLTLGEDRYSRIEQINTQTVTELGLAWYIDLPEKRGQEATPLVIDGIMYTTSAWSHVIALDARTGETKWHYDPKIDKAMGVKACCDAVNRGVAYADGRVFVGALDGRLIALDANTGRELWSTVTVDQTKNYTITGAPRVANGKVFIGNGGAEYGVRGYISAFSAETGEQVWRFYTVPAGPDDPVGTEPPMAAETWHGEWWKFGGGGTVWDSMAVDLETNTLFFGVGNGSPWNPNIRSEGKGDNLFLTAIVAVDIDTGEYRWHYQTTPGTGWDYTATQHMILTDLTIEGEVRKVLMQAPKNGFFYVLDRLNGKLISAEPFVRVTWADSVDKETGRPKINEEAKYWKTNQPVVVAPAWIGGHNWHPMSFSQQTGLVYLPTQETAFPYLAEDDQTPSKLAVNLGVDTRVAAFPDDPNVIDQIKKATTGSLTAWDPVQQKKVWQYDYPGAWNGGVLSTAGGLVFQGSAAGFLNAFDATTGDKLWEYAVQTGVVAPPMSYEIDGEQFITVSAGWGGIFPLMTGPVGRHSAGDDPVNRSRLLTFKLGGSASLPPAKSTTLALTDLSDVTLDQAEVTKGFDTYDRYCTNCHGAGAIGGGIIADLRFSPTLADARTWEEIVIGGAMSASGMASFASDLTSKDAESLRSYVISRNHYARTMNETTTQSP